MTRHIDSKTLDESIREALRFLHAAQALRAARKEAQAKCKKPTHICLRAYEGSTSKENAACWRASMGLTNKLAELRAGK